MAEGLVRRLRTWSPSRFYGNYRTSRKRQETEHLLASLSKTADQKPLARTILVDGTWDNPNYWYRVMLVRRALGLSQAHEIGITGRYNTMNCQRTFERFGIQSTRSLLQWKSSLDQFREQAKSYLAHTSDPGDILQWQLPEHFPASWVYDALLKRQRSAVVDLHHPHIQSDVAESLGYLDIAQKIFQQTDFDLVLLSHAINLECGALAWTALQRGVSVIILSGNYGVPRFARLNVPADIMDMIDRPSGEELNGLSPDRQKDFERIGWQYLQMRLGGSTQDIGSRYAYQSPKQLINKQLLYKQLGWDERRKVVGVYASNWFDYPHSSGMTHFRDFRDWLDTTLKIAEENKEVYWLFKGHPCDAWYGGSTLCDLFPANPLPHIALAELAWNGGDLLRALDGVVTYHGTVGIEAAALGKPVLLSDRGWYHDAGFAFWPKSRQEYLSALAGPWWESLSLEDTTKRARTFAGWYFGHPSWQGQLLMKDDSLKCDLYEPLGHMLRACPDALNREATSLREWYASAHRFYNTYKMDLAE